MSRIVRNITRDASKYDIISQTPKNFNPDNYFLKELQDKIDAEWRFRPNRVDIEYEDRWGEQTYSHEEVVIQSVLSEKGSPISNDCRNIVFRNISEERFYIGNRFRMYRDFHPRFNNEDQGKNRDLLKDVWMATNINKINMTSSVVIERCNGSLGSTYVDQQGISHYHYEPVIQGRELLGTSLRFNEVAVSPESGLVIIAQHNKYTKDYFVNQRFIIGYDKVYRIKAINKFYSSTTFDPSDVGLMRIYLEITEISPYDNFEDRIAYQMNKQVIVEEQGDESKELEIVFEKPDVFPVELMSTPVEFLPTLRDKKGNIIENVQFIFSCSLQNLPETVPVTSYIDIKEEAGKITIYRKKQYLRGNLILKWEAEGYDILASFELGLRAQE